MYSRIEPSLLDSKTVGLSYTFAAGWKTSSWGIRLISAVTECFVICSALYSALCIETTLTEPNFMLYLAALMRSEYLSDTSAKFQVTSRSLSWCFSYFSAVVTSSPNCFDEVLVILLDRLIFLLVQDGQASVYNASTRRNLMSLSLLYTKSTRNV